jgi:hypothetical protein
MYTSPSSSAFRGDLRQGELQLCFGIKHGKAGDSTRACRSDNLYPAEDGSILPKVHLLIESGALSLSRCSWPRTASWFDGTSNVSTMKSYGPLCGASSTFWNTDAPTLRKCCITYAKSCLCRKPEAEFFRSPRRPAYTQRFRGVPNCTLLLRFAHQHWQRKPWTYRENAAIIASLEA